MKTEMKMDSNLQWGLAKSWINGQWVDAAKRTESFDPATGKSIGTYADANLDDSKAAVSAAVNAFAQTPWKDDRRLRAKVLNQIAARFEARAPELIEILSLENGKVHDEAAFEVNMIPSKFRYWASHVLTDYGRAMEVEPGHLSFVTRSAIGVVAVVAPFNSPLVLTVRSLAPALSRRNHRGDQATGQHCADQLRLQPGAGRGCGSTGRRGQRLQRERQRWLSLSHRDSGHQGG